MKPFLTLNDTSCHHVILLAPTDDYFLLVQNLGYSVTVIQEEHRITSTQKAILAEGNVCAFSDIEALLFLSSRIDQFKKVDAVLTFTEYGTLPAALISTFLNCKGPALQEAMLTRNKIMMREHLAGTSLGTVSFLVCSTKAELQAFFANHKDGVIVKPINGTGSQDVLHVTHLDQINSVAFPVLAEAFIDGDEYSCECLSYDGEHHVIAITKKFVGGSTGLVEIGHQVPGIDHTDTKVKVGDFVQEVLSELGICNGASHTELKIDADGKCHLIETHVRPGGDRIWELVDLATQVNQIVATARWFVEGKKTLPPTQEKYHVAIHYLNFKPGLVIAANHTLDSVSEVFRYQFNVKEGTTIKAFSHSQERHGFFIIRADSKDTLRKLKSKAEQSINVVIE
ncbi:ATP-grasp domain-containing protein [Enterovibrio sp. ZSDZ42]|uniref:ATP-grasp domain-containing protein n=1 Tax=Enterovibrio gelatinilyticus TaxID=2899819 RepID=A0ABT5QUQ5_9GAMM|nr:ATP-grasp domain-containing protein [Enterovibrio sp. ZSDZ42]MDD1791721.1 ATP-grasp domain-containing protein [Enterovibrio sp. ZSDZ42]